MNFTGLCHRRAMASAVVAVLKGPPLKPRCISSVCASFFRGFSSRNAAKREILFPSAFRNFSRVSFIAAAADDNTVARSPFTSSTPSADSAVDAPPSSFSVSSSLDAIREAVDALDFRVGLILKAWMHPEADSLYIEEVDVGEPEPRIICSGLVKYIPLDDLQEKKVIVLVNLKPRNMRGVKSNGMLMAASDSTHENVELLFPPELSIPGERIWFGSEDENENQPAAATPNQVQKKKIWESVQPHLKTDGSCVAALGVHPMRTSAGVVKCRSLKCANIS